MIVVAIVLIVVAVAAAVLSHFLTVSNLKNNAESKIGNAEAKAREIIDDAVKTAETKKKESLLEIKEESIKNKNELEKETKERRSELQRYEKRVLSKEENVEKKADALEKKEADVKLSVLNGEWKIKEANSEAIPSGMEKQPFIAFDVKKKSIHGNAGCNLINGGFETSTSNAKSISFPGVASTMMACPDMETEGKILKALNEVKSFDVLAGGGIGLYDANNALVIVLEKK